MKKPLVVVVVVLCSLLFLSLVAIAGCVVSIGNGGHFSLGDMSEKATRQDVLPLEIAAGQTLRVTLPHGDVDVESAADGAATITANITAWGRTQEEADKSLAAAHVLLEKAADGLSISLSDEGVGTEIPGGRMKISAQANFRIRVPEKMVIELHTDSGDLSARGPFAGARLHSSYGKVRVSEVDGDLTADSSSGDVDVAGVKGKRIVAKTDYGDVRLSRAEAPDVEARSSSGDVRAEDLRGAHLTLKSSYGDVEVGKCAGALDARTDSGSVRISGFDGKLVAHSSYGDVKLDGVFLELTADSSSGEVEVRAQPGSKTEGSWSISSSYGDVTLIAPKDFGCDLTAKTNYGDLELGFALTVEAGGLKKKENSVHGVMNGGGGSVTVKTSSGDVRIKPIP